MFKDIYQKTLKLAGHKSSKFYLALISFAESSFFPIPPDIMIIPMVIAKKNEYLKIFFIATLFLLSADYLDILLVHCLQIKQF